MGVVKIVNLRIKEWKGQQKSIEMIPIFFLTIIIQVCTNRTKKCIAYQFYRFTFDTKHGQQYTKTWLHEKTTFGMKIRHNKIYVWKHDTYTKVLGCKTVNNSPPMYTLIMKLPLIWPKQVLWPLWKSYYLCTRFIHKLFIISHHWILIFFDKSYHLSTYLIKIYWLNNSKS